MSLQNIDPEILRKAKSWTLAPYDAETRAAVIEMIEHKPEELEECFYTSLEFGTGGLRGIMGHGTNRMNKYTVGMATQGLANYLKKSFPEQEIRVAVAYDCRHNNTLFAGVVADVLSANGIHTYVFDALRPTPELSFAIRQLQCQSGIMITASHNPKEYNGYKVYWNDGGQLVPPHDKNVIKEVQAVGSAANILFETRPELIHPIGSAIDEAYIAALKAQSLNPALNKKHSSLGIVFTPIHGTAVKLAPMALKAFGFENIINVPEQDVVSGDFPTVHSPNPEEAAALEMAIQKAEESGAELVMATDPDADRVGIALRNPEGKMILLNGNQTAALLIYYVLRMHSEKGSLPENAFIVKTIVTTDLLNDIAREYGVEVMDVLTGFKYIAEAIRLNEGQKTFLGGGEESYGYLIGDYVRDKDAIISCCMIAETAAWAKENGMSLYELLMDIYRQFGVYYEGLLSITKKGKKGAEEIAEMMRQFRESPPASIAGEAVIRLMDYQHSKDIRIREEVSSAIPLPKSNVIQLFTESGSKITVRPSGTEPKVKFYFALKAGKNSAAHPEEILQELKNSISRIKEDLRL